MNCIILFRINGGPVQALRRGDISSIGFRPSFLHEAGNEIGTSPGELHEFSNMDDAVSFARAPDNPFARLIKAGAGQIDFQIVSLDEL